MNTAKLHSPPHQRGAVLVVSLIMLAVLTLFVISMLKTAVVELKIGGVSQTTALNVSAADVSRRLKTIQLDAPGGRGDISGAEQAVRTLGSLKTAEEIAALDISLPDGRQVRMAQIARVSDSIAEPRSLATLDGKPVVGFEILRSKGASEVDVANAARKLIAELQQAYPNVQFETAVNNADPVQENFEGSMDLLYEGALLAVLVVWWFLRDWRATLVAATAVPTSIVGTFAFMDVMGFSLNNMTLLGLILAVGVVIDDAVVVLENVFRHMEAQGLSGWDAASKATQEISLAVVATTLSLVVIFAPIAFMSGQVGRFFNSFGFVVAFAILMSMAVSFTLTPMLCARFLRDVVDLDLEVELDHHRRQAFARDRVHVLDAGDRVHRLLDLAAHLAFHRLGRRPGKLGEDRQHRNLDLGHEVDRQTPEREQPERHEGEHHHRRDDGPLDREIGEEHRLRSRLGDRHLAVVTDGKGAARDDQRVERHGAVLAGDQRIDVDLGDGGLRAPLCQRGSACLGPPVGGGEAGPAQGVGVDHEARQRGAGIRRDLQLVGAQGMHREHIAVGLVPRGRAHAAPAGLAVIGPDLPSAFGQVRAANGTGIRRQGVDARGQIDHHPMPPARAGGRVRVVDGQGETARPGGGAVPAQGRGAVLAAAAEAVELEARVDAVTGPDVRALQHEAGRMAPAAGAHQRRDHHGGFQGGRHGRFPSVEEAPMFGRMRPRRCHYSCEARITAWEEAPNRQFRRWRFDNCPEPCPADKGRCRSEGP